MKRQAKSLFSNLDGSMTSRLYTKSKSADNQYTNNVCLVYPETVPENIEIINPSFHFTESLIPTRVPNYKEVIKLTRFSPKANREGRGVLFTVWSSLNMERKKMGIPFHSISLVTRIPVSIVASHLRSHLNPYDPDSIIYIINTLPAE